jgi:hypothetical protein
MFDGASIYPGQHRAKLVQRLAEKIVSCHRHGRSTVRSFPWPERRLNFCVAGPPHVFSLMLATAGIHVQCFAGNPTVYRIGRILWTGRN